MRKTRRLAVEQLEDRSLLSGAGAVWPDAQALTISFAPDGTSVSGTSSDLFATLSAKASTVTWETEILRAFRTWAGSADINLTLVTDNGAPFGTAGAPQGDPRFGDIRIGAAPLGSADAATTQPFSYTGSTWSGDVLLNSSMDFSVAGGPGVYDLFTVVMHEAGHSFGLDDNLDPTSVMYDTYSGPRTGLSAGDVQSIQALYGPRPANSPTPPPLTTTPVSAGAGVWSGQVGTNAALNNLQAQEAAWLPLVATPSLLPQWNTVGFGTLKGGYQSGWWTLQTPATTDTDAFTLTATVWIAATPSGLSPELSLFDANLNPVAAQVLNNGNGSFTIQLPNVQMGGALYYLQVSSPNPPNPGHGGFSYNVMANLSDGPGASLTQLVSDSLAPSSPQESRTLTTTGDELVQFALSDSATDSKAPPVEMLIYDANGNLVFSETADAGQPAVATAVYLQAGVYTVTFAAVSPNGSWQSPLAFNLSASVLSEPIGAIPINPGTTTSPLPGADPGTSSTVAIVNSSGFSLLFLGPVIPTGGPS
jgi:hypothetical protein